MVENLVFDQVFDWSKSTCESVQNFLWSKAGFWPARSIPTCRDSSSWFSTKNIVGWFLDQIYLWNPVLSDSFFRSFHAAFIFNQLSTTKKLWVGSHSVIFLLINFFVLVLVLVMPVICLSVSLILFVLYCVHVEYQTCWRRRVVDLPKYRPPLVTD